MKYRNAMTNIGIHVGFAVNLPDGTLRVRQNASIEAAWVFTRSEDARPAEFEFEPVTVIYRAEPTQDGVRLLALHVTRMAKNMVPKSFKWLSQKWPINRDFYPFKPEKVGTLTDAIQASLAEESRWPDWLERAAEDDFVLDDYLRGKHSNSHLSNRLLLTGRITTGQITPIPATPELPSITLHLRQSFHRPATGEPDEPPIPLYYEPGGPGFHTFLDRKYPKGGLLATVTVRPFVRFVPPIDGQPPIGTRLLHAIDMVNVMAGDFAPGTERPPESQAA